jgi:hypothetical protein
MNRVSVTRLLYSLSAAAALPSFSSREATTTRAVDSNSHPDFSGGEISFGFIVASVASVASVVCAGSWTWDIRRDNVSHTLMTAPPPSSVPTLNLMGLGMLVGVLAAVAIRRSSGLPTTHNLNRG